jgi:DNA-directed RNA polymerase subunit K/omega
MLYPSIQELLEVTAKNGQERLNKYSITMATAKCARVVTNCYHEQRYNAEKKINNKETDKDLASMINKDYRDEKSVKNAVKEIKEGKFEIYLPGEEGYEDSIKVVENYQEPKADAEEQKNIVKSTKDDFDISDIMDAEEVFDGGDGFIIEGDEDEE